MSLDEKVRVVGAFPPGPGGVLPVIPISIIQAFYTMTAAQSVTAVIGANNLRVRIEPDMRPRLITLSTLPNIGMVGVEDYWLTAFAQAAARGPRMVAAPAL